MRSICAKMRRLSSCLSATRMWRNTERASLEKKPSMRLSQEPCLGRKVNAKRPFGCFPSQARVSLDLWEEGLSTSSLIAVAGAWAASICLRRSTNSRERCLFFDAGVNDAGHQIEAGQQAHGSPADVFLIARESLMNLRLGRQVGRREIG